ncbi:Hint domain-containing protein [Thalassococcus sp. CAU 1522]|uniref:Hint domain-containing protein n=1 Tax=Thalassococcus arenae TaxID=2851652 RepID=A0ABS6N812_9RHOB|nr:Hint domain-containing protein [Thalassococcus arenae]MBV2359685.1 Hint domain-containing protein [Thalassococcus arenae]
MVAASELTINEGASATQMANAIFGDGVTVVSASYSGDSRSSGIYSGGDSTSPGVVPGDTGVILSTGRVRDFTNSSGQSNQSTNTSTNTSGQSNNSQFNSAAGARTYDASFLDVDFIPTGNVMTMQFVFSSEEYPEYTNSQFQDMMAVWVNGVQVPLAVGNGDIDPGNLNPSNNENFFIDNTADQYNTEMDGFTVTMTLTIPVTSGAVNSIRIGIADVADSNYDSNLLIAGDSVQTTLVALEDSGTIYPNGSTTIDALANDVNATGGTLTVTHINGIPVVAGSTVTLASGQSVTLNGDGTFTVTGNGDIEQFGFTYEVASTTGQTDIGIVNIDAVPCFVAGSLIDTTDGPRSVQTLQAGDLVMTRDNGPQPLRWIGRRTVPARGNLAPVRIEAGALGAHGPLMVSPQHRVLVTGALAELLYGAPEVLVAAKHLVNDRSIRTVPGGVVEYVHLLFDRHEILCANGLDSESFLPGSQTADLFERAALEEIKTLFPELDPRSGHGYGPAARPILTRSEARLLCGKAA